MLILSVFCYIIRAINYVFVALKVMLYMSDRLIDNKELLKEWDYSKNTIKPDEVTKGTHKKIWWICSNNHSYEATIPARRRGTGCPYCSGNKILYD